MRKLSPRERIVLALFMEKGRLQPVAAALGRSVHTIRSQKNSAMWKLGANNNVEMVRSAIQKGLVKP